MRRSPEARRKSELGKIHLAKKQLGMDDDTYRAMLHQVGGVDSAAALDDRGRAKVLDHLRKAGFKATPRKHVGQYPGTPHNIERLPEYVAKVEALLADMKLPWSYADAIARNITGGKGAPGKAPGVDRLAWVRNPEHWVGIIAALHVEKEKRAMLRTVDDLLTRLGQDHAYVDSKVTDQARGRWQRNRRYLRLVINMLNAELER